MTSRGTRRPDGSWRVTRHGSWKPPSCGPSAGMPAVPGSSPPSSRADAFKSNGRALPGRFVLLERQPSFRRDAAAVVTTFLDLFADLVREGLEIAGLAARHQPLVRHHRLVAPPAAGIDHVRLDGMIG